MHPAMGSGTGGAECPSEKGSDMTVTTYGNTAATSTTLRDRIADRLRLARVQWGQWRVYRQTLNELSALSDRDLADLAIARSNIPWIAMEAAYGKQ